MTDFTRTREALKAYDIEKVSLRVLWDKAATNEEVVNIEALEKVACDKVRAAFYEDTKEVNSRDRAALVHPDDPWLRRIALSH